MPENHIFVSEIGKVLEIDKDGARFNGMVPSGKILVDGYGVGDVGNIVLRDRRHLAQDGLIVVVATVDIDERTIISGPDIVSRGFVYVRDSEELIREAHDRVAAVLERCEAGNIREWAVIKSQVRDTLSRYLYEKTRRRPMILPIIMEV